MSIFQEKTYIEVWESDLSRFVSEFYGRPWDFTRVEESNNDTYVTFEVLAEGPDFFDDEEVETSLKKWLNAPVPEKGDWQAVREFEQFYPHAAIILWDLYRRGAISVGNYLIHVYW